MLLKNRRFLLSLWVMTFGFATMLLAQDSAKPVDLTAEVARLRAENEQLKKEIAELKAALGATTQSATKPKEVVRVFSTMQEILAKCPEELRPKADPEWYKFTQGKFTAWVRSQLIGMQYEAKLPVSNIDTNNIFGRWQLRASLGSKGFTYFGEDHRLGVEFPITYVDVEEAKAWDKVKPGTLLNVKGVISDATIVEQNHSIYRNKLPRYTITLKLRDYTPTRP